MNGRLLYGVFALGVCVTAMLVAGCGPMGEVVHVVQVEGRIVSYAEPCLLNAYRVEQEACLEGPADKAKSCVDGVRARWRPVIDALAEEHDLRCNLEPAKCAEVKP